MHFAAEDQTDGVFDRLTETIVGDLGVFQRNAEPDELADLLGCVAILENADDHDHGDGKPRIFFVDRRVDDLRLDIVIDHALGQADGAGTGKEVPQTSVDKSDDLVHIKIDAGKLPPTRDMKIFCDPVCALTFAVCHPKYLFLFGFLNLALIPS